MPSSEVSRELAIKYLCGGDSLKMNQPSGGIYQFYYGYRLPKISEFESIVYYRPSYNHYSGLILANFTPDGKLLSEKMISGILGEESQLESYISDDYNIIKEEVKYKFSSLGNYDTIPCKVVRSELFIDSRGIIRSTGQRLTKESNCLVEIECGYIRKI